MVPAAVFAQSEVKPPRHSAQAALANDIEAPLQETFSSTSRVLRKRLIPAIWRQPAIVAHFTDHMSASALNKPWNGLSSCFVGENTFQVNGID